MLVNRAYWGVALCNNTSKEVLKTANIFQTMFVCNYVDAACVFLLMEVSAADTGKHGLTHIVDPIYFLYRQ